MAKHHDVVVIGSGPGGYIAAIRCAQLGMDVACIEKEPKLGGTCLRVGCIPSKALLHSSEHYWQATKEFAEHGIKVGDVQLDLPAMMARKDKVVDSLTSGVAGLFKKNKVTRYSGLGSFKDAKTILVKGDDGEETITADKVLIATGSVPSSLPGIELDGDRIGTSTDAIAYPEVPKRLVIIGAGIIGLELGSVWNRLGAEVIVLEYLDRIFPGMDAEIAREAHKIFKKQGIEFRLGSKVTGAKVDGDKCVVTLDGADPVEADRVLVAVGRKPNTEGLGLEKIGIETEKRGQIPVDEHFRTSVENVYAIGDVIHGPMLAHKAEEEGVACAEIIATGHGHVNYNAIPSVVYTWPEVASVGKTEEELKDAGVEYKKGIFPLKANGRARCLGDTDGKVKVLADAKTDRLLGIHIVGPAAGDLIAEAAVAMEFKASSEDIARSSHAHPTLAESLKEACLDIEGRTLNF